MPATRKEKLDKVILTIQKRWGAQAIGRSARQLDGQPPPIPSGFTELDAALGGGIPRGRISELIGAPTAGITTVVLKIMAQQQAVDGSVVYLDLDRSFDPAYARGCAVVLERMTLVHPVSAGQALEMLPDFVHNGGFDLFVCDIPLWMHQQEQTDHKLASTLGRLLSPLSKSRATLLFLTTLPAGNGRPARKTAVYPPQAALPHYTTLRLLLRRRSWRYHQRDVIGCEVEATVLKHKLAAAGQEARFTVLFDESPGL